ncbi:drug/metabolite transporter (DMT)-like permease [Pacificibacter maritimus]|uniref:Drug/metabolite transporter (DMT)-like permease n=1 Tax=Pacificibacter maritimus TaxID=762213 RepID=A0A3N4URC0_9RHOB|nr:DMT family transporter [Pacificibacter maritimus]RPE71205.1 drug/metabolite transporter (DMT)-like permease [Pacificibacter maritimus]
MPDSLDKTGAAGNLMGAMSMVAAMALFAVEDTLLKHVSQRLPVSQILILFGLGGTFIFACLTWQRGERIFNKDLKHPALLIRAVFEVLGRLFFTLSLALTALSTTSAILQATPLLVAAASAVIFREKINGLRWSLIGLGFVGVLLVLRPGLDGFSSLSILAVLGMIGFAGRDLATRAAPKGLSYAQLGVYGFAMLVVSGVILLAWRGEMLRPTGAETLTLACATFVGVAAYTALTMAMRLGEVSVVTPFRYSRLLFAMILAALIFNERPDPLELTGGAVIVLSGLALMLTARKGR